MVHFQHAHWSPSAVAAAHQTRLMSRSNCKQYLLMACKDCWCSNQTYWSYWIAASIISMLINGFRRAWRSIIMLWKAKQQPSSLLVTVHFLVYAAHCACALCKQLIYIILIFIRLCKFRWWLSRLVNYRFRPIKCALYAVNGLWRSWLLMGDRARRNKQMPVHDRNQCALSALPLLFVKVILFGRRPRNSKRTW